MIQDTDYMTLSKNLLVFQQQWHPVNKSKVGSLILLHGLGEHSGRYSTHFAKFWTENGFSIFTFDFPGFGKSGGKRGHIDQSSCLLKIIDRTIQIAKSINKELPVYIYGHSLGGEIALWYSMTQKTDVSGMILTAPAIGPKEKIPVPKLLLAKIMDRIFPSFALDHGLHTELISKDKNIFKAYQSDPLVHRLVSARYGMMILDQGNYIISHASENVLPTLIMIGSEEGLVKTEAIEEFCQKAPLVELKYWPGLYHELHNEPEKDLVFHYALDWIKRRIT